MKKKETVFTCCFCGHKFPEREANNAEPVVEHGECCSDCNIKHVIPARMKLLKDVEIDQQTAENMNYVVNLFTIHR